MRCWDYNPACAHVKRDGWAPCTNVTRPTKMCRSAVSNSAAAFLMLRLNLWKISCRKSLRRLQLNNNHPLCPPLWTPPAFQVWEGRWRVIPFHVLPEWLKDNDYLLHGHRPPMPSFRACFGSIFRIHTETGNIWTHLLGERTKTASYICGIRKDIGPCNPTVIGLITVCVITPPVYCKNNGKIILIKKK